MRKGIIAKSGDTNALIDVNLRPADLRRIYFLVLHQHEHFTIVNFSAAHDNVLASLSSKMVSVIPPLPRSRKLTLK